MGNNLEQSEKSRQPIIELSPNVSTYGRPLVSDSFYGQLQQGIDDHEWPTAVNFTNGSAVFTYLSPEFYSDTKPGEVAFPSVVGTRYVTGEVELQTADGGHRVRFSPKDNQVDFFVGGKEETLTSLLAEEAKIIDTMISIVGQGTNSAKNYLQAVNPDMLGQGGVFQSITVGVADLWPKLPLVGADHINLADNEGRDKFDQAMDEYAHAAKRLAQLFHGRG